MTCDLAWPNGMVGFNVNDTVFKYFGNTSERPPSNWALKALEDLELKATPPSEFNDPFEFSPLVRTGDPKELALRLYKKCLIDPTYYNQNRGRLSPHLDTFEKFKSALLAHPEEFQRDTAEGVGEGDAIFRTKFLPYVSEQFGVVCFSGVDRDPLMWAHYASAHQGVLLEFSPKDSKPSWGGLFEVDYSENRAIYDPTTPDGRQVIEFMRRKSAHWAYEKESRLLVQLKVSTRERISEDGGRNVYMLPIAPNCVVSVAFGLRCPEMIRSGFMTVLAQPHFSHVKLYEMRLSDETFELLRVPIEDTTGSVQ